MGRIAVLQELTANQIAAGEVVERPASVVKELIENALDASATQVDVAIVGGGLESIVVTDNGSGMEGDDIYLAFVRHATSKMRDIDDLRRLQTLGFRGEALPSIAAVSRVCIRTRLANEDAGREVSFEGGQPVRTDIVGCAVGTRVTVTDVFYNTPARLKFVRSLQTESQHVVDAVARMAAARPDVSFSVLVDGRRALQSVGDGTLLSVFHEVFGKTAAQSVLAIWAEHPDYTIRGLTSLPEHAKTSRSHMWFSINGRPIRHIGLGNAVLDGYYTAMPKGRFPLTLLSLQMDPALVDVNVHPSKLEVRFSEEADLKRLVARAIADALQAGLAVPQIPIADSPSPIQTLPQDRSQGSFGVTREYPRVASGYGAGRLSEPKSEPVTPVVRQTDVQQILALMDPAPPREAPALHDARSPLRTLRPVAQVLSMYIVAEDGEAVYIIDQHAAHERVLYEKFLHQFRDRGVDPLPLLVPVPIELSARDMDRVLAQADDAAKLGFTYEAFGDTTLVVRTVPDFWEGLAIQRLAADVLEEMIADEDAHRTAQPPGGLAVMEARLILRACKAAIKANQTLSMPEMEALLTSLSMLDQPFTCPHGRPTAVTLTRHQLERAFKRA